MLRKEGDRAEIITSTNSVVKGRTEIRIIPRKIAGKNK